MPVTAIPSFRLDPGDGTIYVVFASPLCPALTLVKGDKVILEEGADGSRHFFRLRDRTRHKTHYCGHHVWVTKDVPAEPAGRPVFVPIRPNNSSVMQRLLGV